MTIPFQGIPLVMVNPVNQSMTVAGVPTITGASSNGNQLQSKLHMAFITRATSAGLAYRWINAPAFHGVMNSIITTDINKIVIEDVVRAGFGAALSGSQAVWGFFEWIGTTAAGLCGVGFVSDENAVWSTFVRDSVATTSPSTLQHGVNTGVAANANHKLTIVFNGETKTIDWYIDGNLVDTYVVPAGTPLEYMGAQPKFGAGLCIPASGNAVIYNQAGVGAQMRLSTKALTPSVVLQPPMEGQLFPRGVAATSL